LGRLQKDTSKAIGLKTFEKIAKKRKKQKPRDLGRKGKTVRTWDQ